MLTVLTVGVSALHSLNIMVYIFNGIKRGCMVALFFYLFEEMWTMIEEKTVVFLCLQAAVVFFCLQGGAEF